MASLLTYKNGILADSGTAFFIGDNGDLVAAASLLAGVDSAVVIDAKGVVRPVRNIVGVNDMFGCVRIRVAWDKKIVPLSYKGSKVQNGDVLYMPSYGGKKGGEVRPLTVSSVDSVYSNAYYTLDASMRKAFTGYPLLNANGELVAIMQPSATTDTLKGYAVSATILPSMSASVSNFGRGFFNGMAIRTALPARKEDALQCLYMQGIIGDSLSYALTIEEFLSAFPATSEGYITKGEYEALYRRDMDVASKAWDKAMELADSVAYVHFSKAKTIFNIVQSGDSTSHPMLSNINAFASIDAAIASDPQPLYLNYKADMLFLCGRMSEAAGAYEALAVTNLRSPEMYAKASQCYGAIEEYDKSIAMLDSAVNYFGSIGRKSSAPYILTRAIVKMTAGRYRDAVHDYNSYEEVVGGGLNANFYYMREQAELKARMFQQALNDIEMAIYLDSANAMYYVEKGVLCYRVRMTDEGLRVMEKAADLAPDAPDVHYLLGCLYSQKGDKSNARKSLEKAVSLGHPDAKTKLDELDS
jgi:tetratricopeptide (TPR) repeat protein